MGGMTPNFNIRFPFQNEVVTTGHFSNFAADVDAALTVIDNLRTRALNMPSVCVQGPSGEFGTTVNAGAVTNVSLSGGTVFWDTNNMWNPAQPDRATVKTKGVYQFVVAVGGSYTNATTMNASELQAQFFGSNPYSFLRKFNREGQTGLGYHQVSGLWLCQVNDYVRVNVWFNGTGSVKPNYPTITLQKVADIP